MKLNRHTFEYSIIIFLSIYISVVTPKCYGLTYPNGETLSVSEIDTTTVLYLNGMDLTTLPSWIFRYKNLKSIHLDENPKLNWLEVFQELSKFDSLQKISIKNNEIKYLPDNINNIRSLISIDISRNNLFFYLLHYNYCQTWNLSQLIIII